MKASEHCPICSSFTFHCNHILPPSGWERTIHMLHCTLRVCFYDISDNCSSKRWRRRLHRVGSGCVCACVGGTVYDEFAFIRSEIFALANDREEAYTVCIVCVCVCVCVCLCVCLCVCVCV